MKRQLLILLSLAVVCGCGKVDLAGENNGGDPNDNDTENKDPNYHYSVGERYSLNGKEGIVFCITDNGLHGKIVSEDETECAWSTEQVYTGARDEDDGMANMKKIKSISGWRKKYPAFAWCADKGDGWYLPALNELKTLYESEYGNLIGSDYRWSSTEESIESVWCVRMRDGYTYRNRKRDLYYVRAVSAF